MIKNDIQIKHNLELFVEYLIGRKYSKSTISNYFFGVKDFIGYLMENNLDDRAVTNESIIEYKKYLVNAGNVNQTINSKLYSIVKYFEYLKAMAR